jgi:hypothetical protein
MLPSHFVADAIDGGHTYTLPSRLGGLLAEAERLFGRRDLSYTILGVEFGPETPQLWFPRNCKHVLIQLHRSALSDNVLALYQLAHECIHLLAPTGGRGAPVIEEGLATVFSEDWVEKSFGRRNMTTLDSYKNAAALVRSLLVVEPDAIKKLRERQPSFANFTPDDFAACCPTVHLTLVEQLIAPFDRDFRFVD